MPPLVVLGLLLGLGFLPPLQFHIDFSRTFGRVVKALVLGTNSKEREFNPHSVQN